ncbi:hypothetical protein FHR36_001984 [Kitasatospora paracochleata]|uniref:Uncharacterized protein n=1 Tax=Kitasatospora paracochleata TaxID=58354 RepID=A0ABT1IUP5_9ACTN|nr:hypothetical protein [Kitasatospora paracochleata]
MNAGMCRVEGRCGPRQRSPPAHLAGLRVQVVVDGQLAGADLDVRTLARGGGGALEADQLQLERLAGQLLAGASSVTTRRENFCPRLMISCIFFSTALRSSGWNGFYYDFDVEKPFHPDDLKAVEKKMQEIIKRGQKFSRAGGHRRGRPDERGWPASRSSWS